MDKYNQNIDIPQDNIKKTAVKATKITPPKKANPKIIALIGLLGLGLLSLIVTFIAQSDLPNRTNSSSSKLNQSSIETPVPVSDNPWQIELNSILTNLNSESPIPIISVEENLTF